MSQTKKQPTFQQSYAELESITQQLESGNLDLETAIPQFKKATKLAANLKKRLQEMEVEIEQINLELESSVETPSSDQVKDIEF